MNSRAATERRLEAQDFANMHPSITPERVAEACEAS
jgi:hypothetical protein